MNKDVPLSGGEIDTLVAIVENGPCESGDTPSKVGRTGLILRGYAFYTVVKGEQGYLAVTPTGVEAYKTHFGTSMEENGKCVADTIGEAKANRIARRALRNVSNL